MYCFSRLGRLGRLGNQLFQVAATVAAAERSGTRAKFPPWRYAQYFRGEFDQTLDESDSHSTYYEPDGKYSEIPEGAELDLFGFFQSRRYFLDQENTIRELFQFKDDLLPAEWTATPTPVPFTYVAATMA